MEKRLETSKAFEDYYILGEELGHGASATVYKCQQKGTDKYWAVKILNKTKYQRLAAVEAGILLKLKHPNIVRLKEVFESKKEIHMVLELVTGGELLERIVTRGHYSEKEAAIAVKDMLKAVSYLHQNGVAHRDLKPENMLYDDLSASANLKVNDFGLSKILGKDATMFTVCGTPVYCAPEIFQGKKYTKSVDMWSLGVVTYILLAGYEPFIANTDKEMFKKIMKGDYEFDSPYWDNISENAKDLIRRMLTVDPNKRITASQASQHPWVMGMAAKNVHMEATVEKIKEFNAKRKLQKATEAVLAVARATRHLPLDMVQMVNLGEDDTQYDKKDIKKQ